MLPGNVDAPLAGGRAGYRKGEYTMKKLLALLLSLVMVLGMIPTAFAAESMLVTAIDVEGQSPRPEIRCGQ